MRLQKGDTVKFKSHIIGEGWLSGIIVEWDEIKYYVVEGQKNGKQFKPVQRYQNVYHSRIVLTENAK